MDTPSEFSLLRFVPFFLGMGTSRNPRRVPIVTVALEFFTQFKSLPEGEIFFAVDSCGLLSVRLAVILDGLPVTLLRWTSVGSFWIDLALRMSPKRTALGRVDGEYYLPHLSVRTGRARFRASGSRYS